MGSEAGTLMGGNLYSRVLDFQRLHLMLHNQNDTDDNSIYNRSRNYGHKFISSTRRSNSMNANLVSEVNDIITPQTF